MRLLEALERRRLGTKLLLGFAGVLAIALLLGAQSQWNLRAMQREADQIYRLELLGIAHLKEANVNLAFQGRALRSMMLATEPAARERARAEIATVRAALRSELVKARAAVFRPENLRKLDEFEQRLALYESNVDRAIELTHGQSLGSGEAAAFVTSPEFAEAGRVQTYNSAA